MVEGTLSLLLFFRLLSCIVCTHHLMAGCMCRPMDGTNLTINPLSAYIGSPKQNSWVVVLTGLYKVSARRSELLSVLSVPAELGTVGGNRPGYTCQAGGAHTSPLINWVICNRTGDRKEGGGNCPPNNLRRHSS